LVDSLERIATLEGKDSIQLKQQYVSQVLDKQATQEEYMYMVRLLMGNLRIGIK
jgi:ATP-dependent DNA ligase